MNFSPLIGVYLIKAYVALTAYEKFRTHTVEKGIWCKQKTRGKTPLDNKAWNGIEIRRKEGKHFRFLRKQ